LIAVCGNLLAGDDGFGPLVAAELQSLDLPGVEILDLGMNPAALVCRLEGRSGLVLVDAAACDAEFPPGQLIDLDFFDSRRPTLLHDARLSSHSLSLAHELELARQLNILPPRVRLIAAPAASTGWGEPVRPAVQALVQPAARRAVELARQWRGE
jgi:hydrogenase maturation protease